MASTVAFGGSALPVSVLREKMRDTSALLNTGGELSEPYEYVYSWHGVSESHKRFETAIDSFDRSCATLADLHKELQHKAEVLAVPDERESRVMPLVAAATAAGGILTVTGLGYAALTAGLWCTGGLVGAAVGAVVCLAGGLKIKRRVARMNAAEHARNNVEYVRNWGEALERDGKLPPPLKTPTQEAARALDPRNMTVDEKKALLERLRLEIREAEQRRDARVDVEGDTVNIGGVKVKVRS